MHLDLPPQCSLNLILILSLLPSTSHSTYSSPQNEPSPPEFFACNRDLPLWGGTFGSWGLFRNPSVDLNPWLTGEILDLRDLCSRKRQLVPLRRTNNFLLSTVMLQEDTLLYDGRCEKGRAEFTTVNGYQWRHLAGVFLPTLSIQSIEALWRAHERVARLCRDSCFCQDETANRDGQQRLEEKVWDSRTGEWVDNPLVLDRKRQTLPYRDHFERPYGPFWPEQGAVLARNGEQGVCDAWSRKDYSLDEDSKDLSNLPPRERKEALRQIVRCMASSAGSTGG